MKKTKLRKLLYTLRHKVAFLRVEYRFTGGISWRGMCHDSDKVWMYLFSSKTMKEVHRIHRKFSRHHVNDLPKTRNDYIEMIIDWECARITKPDKQLNAYETLHKFYPELKGAITPILIELDINKPDHE